MHTHTYIHIRSVAALEKKLIELGNAGWSVEHTYIHSSTQTKIHTRIYIYIYICICIYIYIYQTHTHIHTYASNCICRSVAALEKKLIELGNAGWSVELFLNKEVSNLLKDPLLGIPMLEDAGVKDTVALVLQVCVRIYIYIYIYINIYIYEFTHVCV
jgi:hypothetical protein